MLDKHIQAIMADEDARFKCILRVGATLSRIKFPGYKFNYNTPGNVVYIYIEYEEPDIFTGINETQRGRRWLIDTDWTEAQIAQTCLKAVLTSLEHRAREHFTVDGRAIFNPHHTLEQLYQLSEGQDREEHHEEIPICKEIK